MTMTMRAPIGLIVCAMMALAPATHGDARPAGSKLEARIADLKAKTAALVAAARAPLEALPPQQRLAAPPAIWEVPGALTAFKECAFCPQMVVIPAGEFTMGSPESEPFRAAETQHRVTIAAAFAVSKFEITFDEWRACVKDRGCDGYWPDDQKWGPGRRPVIHVTWEHAKAYV